MFSHDIKPENKLGIFLILLKNIVISSEMLTNRIWDKSNKK